MPAGVSAITALANVTLGSSAAAVTFSSISGSYRDLIIVCSPLAASPPDELAMQFNTDTGNNYNAVYMHGDGATKYSGNYSNTGYLTFHPNAYVYGVRSLQNTAQIMDYSATDKHKSVLVRSDTADNATAAVAGRWASTAAITSIKIYCRFGNLAAGSTFALYGVSS